MMTRRAFAAFALGLTMSCDVAAAQTLDRFKVALGSRETWGSHVIILGQNVGIFRKQGVELDIFGTVGAGETLQAVISGAADLGINVGASGVLRAFVKGAPVRAIGADFTGVGDLFWFVRADSPLRSLKDFTERTTVGYSSSGSSSHAIVLAFREQVGAKLTPVAAGSQVAALTQVMSGQIDVGNGAPPIGLKEIDEGQIRVVATGNDVPSMRDQTLRLEIANANVLRERPDAVRRFARAYREALDWMYDDPNAVRMYAEANNIRLDIAKRAAFEFQPKSAKLLDHISNLDGVIADAVKLKFLDGPLTPEQIKDFVQIPAP